MVTFDNDDGGGVAVQGLGVDDATVDLRVGGEESPLYDQAEDPESPANDRPKRRRARAAAVVDTAAEQAPTQLEIELPPGTKPSAWKLPPMKLLDRSGSQSVDRSEVEEVGHRLEHALAEHGVETRLVGMTVGPTVTRYELELGPGVKVAVPSGVDEAAGDVSVAATSAVAVGSEVMTMGEVWTTRPFDGEVLNAAY